MAKKWYPVIDILTCQECGSCVAKCTHGVYDKSKAPVPVVVNPDNCIDHCHGCGKLCPIGAIAYVGDDTGWIAPALQNQPQAKEECCCCGSTSKGKKEIKIEYGEKYEGCAGCCYEGSFQRLQVRGCAGAGS